MQRLLMIEDDARLAAMVSEYLEPSGYEVAHAADGEAGLAALQAPATGALPQLVILDLMLPGIDGLEVCRRLRTLPGPASQVPVLMDGGIRRGGDIVKAMALGASACLVGRAGLYGLASGGRAGVERAISMLQKEIDITQALLGIARLSEIDRSALFPER